MEPDLIYLWTSSMSLSLLRRGLLLACCLILAACGFHLRGPQPLPFTSIYLGMGPNSPMAGPIKHQIAINGGGTRITDKPEDAQVRMIVVRDSKSEEVATISGSGVVNQYELRQRFAFRLIDDKGHEIMPLNEIYVYRYLDFATGQELSKEQEEAVLFADMQKDVVSQLMRRLAAAKLD